MDGVPPAGPKNAVNLLNDGRLALITLHGQHRFADGNVDGLVVQSGVVRPALENPNRVGRHMPRRRLVRSRRGQVSRIRVFVDSRVGGRLFSHDLLGSFPKPRGQLHDIMVVNGQRAEHLFGQLAPAGTEDLLTHLRQEPVSRLVFDGTITHRKPWHFFSLCWP